MNLSEIKDLKIDCGAELEMDVKKGDELMQNKKCSASCEISGKDICMIGGAALILIHSAAAFCRIKKAMNNKSILDKADDMLCKMKKKGCRFKKAMEKKAEKALKF